MSIKKKHFLIVLIFSLGCFSQNKIKIKYNDSIVGNENLAYNIGLVYDNRLYIG